MWPGLFTAPRSPLRARVAESLFRNAVRTLPVTVRLPDGRVVLRAVTMPRLRIAGTRSFGDDCAETLRRWRETFLTRWDEVRELGFDDSFRRMWEFDPACSEAGFRVGYLGVQ